MKVLVTGGTGFIGSALVRHLVAAKYEVRVLARQPKDNLHLKRLGVEVLNGDVTSAKEVEKAVEGCSVVFNLASAYTFYPFWMKEPKDIYRINVAGTVNMLEASLKYRVKKFIHTSTIATIGPAVDGNPSDENTGFDLRTASHYARSKYQAEQEVLKFWQKGLPVVILNPAIVIGERDYKPTPSGEVIVKFLNRKYPGYFEAFWSVADVDDVARAHMAAVELGRSGERYILANSQHYTFRQVFQLLEKVAGVPAPRLKIPYGVLLVFTYLDEIISHFMFRSRPLMPAEGIKFCKRSVTLNNSKAVRELGYTETPIEETLKKAVSWYRKNAFVEPRGIFRIKAHGSRLVHGLMRILGMDAFTDKLNPGTLLFWSVLKILGLLRRMGVAKGRDGWRVVTQSYLRTEQSKFSLTAFNLDLGSGAKGHHERTWATARQYCLKRLMRSLKRHPVLQAELRWSRLCAEKFPKKSFDLVAADFEKNGNLRSLELYLDSDEVSGPLKTMPLELKKRLSGGIIQVYNQTKDLPDKKRPLVFKRELRRWISQQALSFSTEWKASAEEYAGRSLSAVFVQFEMFPRGPGERSARFKVPPFSKMKHPGFGILSIVCRLSGDFSLVDLWMQFNHMGLDGVPAQEILDEIKKEWGVKGGFSYPAADDREAMFPERVSSGDGEGGIFHIHQFLDFQPFLRERNEVNKRWGGCEGRGVSVVALLVWKLSQYPEFQDVKFAVPVDVCATGSQARTLGFVFIRPSIYYDPRSADRGLRAFQQAFEGQVVSARKRCSASWKILDAYAAASPGLYALTTRFLLSSLQAFTGAVGVTVIKTADFFTAPSNDGHTSGFIACSNFLLSGEEGSKVCGVSIKGPKEKVTKYMNVLRDVSHRAIQNDELYF